MQCKRPGDDLSAGYVPCPAENYCSAGVERISAVSRQAVTSPWQFARHHWTSLALLVLGFGLFAFIGIADEVLDGDSMRFDEWLLLALRVSGDAGNPLGPAWVEEMFRDFTSLGGVGVLGLLTISSVAYLWLQGLRHIAVFVLLAILGGLLLSLALKSGFDRPRPDLVSHGSAIST